MELMGDISRRQTTAQVTGRSMSITKALLACGVALGPFFLGVSLVQAFTRPGFDIRHHAISVLSLGDLGWIQITNFEISGLLAVACALGIRRTLRGRRAGTFGPVLIGLYGVGSMIAGVFHPDPGLGFPPGAPAGMPTTMSWHSSIHQLAFMVSFASVIAACFVLARFFAGLGSRAWVLYCVGVGILTPVLIVLGISLREWVGVIFFIVGMVALGWVATISLRLMRERGGTGLRT
jgi:hypothetical membrane protein